jgi:ABC-2 type transport system ATP-binding protein
MSLPLVVAEHLVKWYGPRLALRDVSFTVAQGEVVGLLGPNGSGKSTLFRILTGYLTPSSGTASIAGNDAVTQSLGLRHEVGYVPEDAPLYDHMRVAEFLGFMARLKGLRGRAVGAAVDRVAARLQLESVLSVLIVKLSRGYRQRVAIAQALQNNPKLLVLDEPTSGLDPSQVIAVRDLIGQLAGQQTVMIASHVLPEIEQIANRVMILLDGELLTTDARKCLNSGERLRLKVGGGEREVRAALANLRGVHIITAEPGAGNAPATYLIEAEPPLSANEIATALVNRQLAIFELAPGRASLEGIFLDLTRRPRENVV